MSSQTGSKYFRVYLLKQFLTFLHSQFSFVLNLKDKKSLDENSDHNQMDLDDAMNENLLLTTNTNTPSISKPTTAEELFDRIKAVDKPIEQNYPTFTAATENKDNLPFQTNTENLIANSESMDRNNDIKPEIMEDNFSEHQRESLTGDMRHKRHQSMDNIDPLPDSDFDGGDESEDGREHGEIGTTSYSHSPPTATSSAIPTISIRMKGDPSGDPICIKTTNEPSGSDYLHQSIKSLVSPPANKKRKEDKDRSGKIDDGGQEKEHKDKNNKDRHHKDKKKKKKKKKHKQKHKHKDRHSEMEHGTD